MTVANFNFQDTKISILMFDLQFVIVITYDWRERERDTDTEREGEKEKIDVGEFSLFNCFISNHINKKK